MDQEVIKEIERLTTHIVTELNDIFNLMVKIQKNVEEQRENMDKLKQLLQPLNLFPPTLESQVVPMGSPGAEDQVVPMGSPGAEDQVVPASPEKVAEQLSEDEAGTPGETPQDPAQNDTRDPQPPICWEPPAEAKEWMQPPGATPQLWDDLLTEQLWQFLLDNQMKDHTPKTQKLEDPFKTQMADQEHSVQKDSLSFEETGQPPQKAQDPKQLSFLKLLSWDPEDFEDSWKRPTVPLLPSKRSMVPLALEKLRVLQPGQQVLSVAVSSFTRHAFTCSRRGVHVWNLQNRRPRDRFPESQLWPAAQSANGYLCTCILSSDSRRLLAGGHQLPGVAVWDLTAPCLHVARHLPVEGRSCQALAMGDHMAFGGFTDGCVKVWDLRCPDVVRDLVGPLLGVKTLAVRDHTLWAGGSDACLCHWDLRGTQKAQHIYLGSQIMSMSHSPKEDWLLVGLADGQHRLLPTTPCDSPGLKVVGKGKTILGLKFAPNGQWWVSVGLDDLVTIHSMPRGAKTCQIYESGSICCDVAANSRLIMTGSRNHASVYQVIY